uniref:TATA box binding protein associated factor (TAF) histone-like fold domain-containing protein n=1 Tax=Panagrolaimus superbus TaxID=310955 RepID=A0A914Y239_9BILA
MMEVEKECVEFGIEYVKDVAESFCIGSVSEATAKIISTHVNCLIKLLLISARSNRIAAGRVQFDVGDIQIAAKELGLDITSTFWNINKSRSRLIKPTDHCADSFMNNKIFGDIVIQPHWLVTDGEVPTIQENLVPSFRGLELGNKIKEEPYEFFEKAWKTRPKLEACIVRTKFTHPTSTEQQNFFKETMEMMVGNDEAKRKKAMHILRNDPSIQLLVPRMVSFISSSLRANIAQECLALISYLLMIADALLSNPYIDVDEDFHILIPPIISCILIRSPNLDQEGTYMMRKFAAKIIYDIFTLHDLPNARHRVLRILTNGFRHSRTSIPSLVAIIYCFKLFGPEFLEIYLFQHIPKIKQLTGNYKPPKEIVENDMSNRKQDSTKLGDAIFEAFMVYCSSPLMYEKTLEHCKEKFGPFGEDVFKRIKVNNNSK